MLWFIEVNGSNYSGRVKKTVVDVNRLLSLVIEVKGAGRLLVNAS